MTKSFISLDWGTTSFRARLIDGDGKIANEAQAPEGIMAVKNGEFEQVLESHIGAWDKSLPLVASGMITSRQGWIETPYQECPASAHDLATSVKQHTTKSGRKLHFITGMHYQSPSIGHDVIRGEETQVFGTVKASPAHVISRGTHPKWIDVENNKIIGFATYVTGESFALFRDHSILGRLMSGSKHDEAAFAQGVKKSLKDRAILHSLFSVRTLGLFNELPPEALNSYLSGLLIGAEIAHAAKSRSPSATYLVIGAPELANPFVTAMQIAGLHAELGDPLCTIRGQAMIAKEAAII